MYHFAPERVLALVIAAALCGIGSWAVRSYPFRSAVPEPDVPAVLADRIAQDPGQVTSITAEYLHTSWRDQEGTVLTITGLRAVVDAAGEHGHRGRAARAALSRLNAAVAFLEQRDPGTAADIGYAARALGITTQELTQSLPAVSQ